MKAGKSQNRLAGASRSSQRVSKTSKSTLSSNAGERHLFLWHYKLLAGLDSVGRFDIIEGSDLILVMEERHKKHVVEHFPQAEHKTWLLREFTQGTREDVVDPISFAHNSYEQVVLELEEELNTLWERIFG